MRDFKELNKNLCEDKSLSPRWMRDGNGGEWDNIHHESVLWSELIPGMFPHLEKKVKNIP